MTAWETCPGPPDLDHLSRLGVDAVWITPFYPSPLADGGYDISDHTAVAPDLGTDADFDALVRRAHALDLKVLVDLVPNHTSDGHPWFRQALADGPGSRARQRYLFRPGAGSTVNSRRTTGSPRSAGRPGPGWSKATAPGEWYLHLHAPQQPDLNWRDPEVVADFERVLRHSGWTAVSTASGWTSPTRCSRSGACPTPDPASTRTSCATT